MSKHEIIVTDTVSDQIEEIIGGGLNSYNDEVTGYADRRPLAVLVTDPETGEVLGGATGRSSLGLPSPFVEISSSLPTQPPTAGLRRTWQISCARAGRDAPF